MTLDGLTVARWRVIPVERSTDAACYHLPVVLLRRADMKRFLVAGLSLVLIGCAGSGSRIDASRLSEVRKGETTIAAIVERFGRPSLLSKNMDGTQTAAYVHADAQSSTGALVPLMGALAGNPDVDSVIFYFDTKGVLSDYKVTQAMANAPAQAPADKPASASAAKTTQPDDKAPATATAADTGKAPRSESKPWSFRGWQPSAMKENR